MIDEAFTKTYTVKRMSANGSYVEGVYVPGTVEEFEVDGSVQPLSGKDKLSLSEGDRIKDTLKIYVETKLRLGSPGTLKQSDIIVIDDFDYEVRTVEDWTRNNTILPHHKALLVYDNRNEEANMGVP